MATSVFRGASYGAIQGAGEAEAVSGVADAAREAASESGLWPEEATMQIAIAAGDPGPDGVVQFREALERERVQGGTDGMRLGDDPQN